MRFETLAVHAGREIEANENEPLTHPIVLSTVFERAQDASYKHDLSYTRERNPNRQWLESALAQLEGGARAAAFASGSAATLAVLQALAPGDHVIASSGYYGTTKLLKEVMRPWGLEATLIDTSDVASVEKAITKKTQLVWLETPSNPMIKVTDLAAVAKIVHAAGAKVVVDNTAATPVFQRPLELGADLVMHSTTKYLGGHSDVLGGAIISKEDDALFGRIHVLQGTGGAVPSPFDCWLLQRGIKTLHLRVRQQAANALALATYLHRHPKVERTLYAGLPSHPGHDIAVRQMKGGFGGLFSFLVKGGRDEALKVMGALRLVHRATSLGGTESTIDHRESVEPLGYGTPANLLRLSCGIEHVDDLREDLEQALKVI
jgi:cystathionine gamma-synthase